MNVLWRFPLHYPSQVNQQSNIITNNRTQHQNTSKHWYQHIKPTAPRHPRSYHPTSQQDLAIFYHQILCCPKNPTLLQAVNDGSFSTFLCLTSKIITKYLSESEINSKGHLNQQKQLTFASTDSNVTPIATK